MDVMILVLHILFLQISSIPRDFALDNCTELQRHKRLAKNGDYIGCYDLECLNLEHNVSFPENLGATPESCAERCGDKGFILAYIYQGSGCSCSCDGESLENPVEDYKCGMPCRQDVNIFCGGLHTSAVYKVRSPNQTAPNISRSNTTDGTKQNKDGSDGKPQHYTTLVSFLVISCIIICALVITVVVFHRRLRKWTSSRSIRFYSRRVSSRLRNRHTVPRSHAVEDGDEHDNQVGAAMGSPIYHGHSHSTALRGSLGNDSQSPAVDDTVISPYKPYEVSSDQGVWDAPHYSTLKRTEVVVSSFEDNDYDYAQPGVGLGLRKTLACECGKDGYLIPGSTLTESTPEAYSYLNR